MTPAPSSDPGTLPMSSPPPGLARGQVLGTRYRITSLLGRGGMGEVWQAYDLKLQVDVALKAIRAERFPGEQGIELLRREVRAAREVMSPNVCRIFDLVDEDDHEFVSMEYIDGRTLLQILRDRGPLDLSEATRIASQFLAGLEAIHQAGLVHRDVKPENIMVTRTGRVVLMDFGVAKGVAEDARGTIAGTPAYMAPEQMRGEALDPRADIFAAGVVLAEMSAPQGVKDRDSRESVWARVREAPPTLPEGPWREVVERAVAPDRGRRYGSARELARALEEVTFRVEGAENKRPYPGLASFTEADAEFFFGREIEVEAVWKKLQRATLLAIIGPSGAGKTSFVQAGLIPAKPAGWEHVLLRPGASPFVALARALAQEMSGDQQAIDQLFLIEDTDQALAAVGRWRSRHPQALLIVDQFEELFTLCPSEVQARFADLLGRLAAEADVHVLLVLRDDFLIRCQEHSRLAPVFAELTPLVPPTGSSLRRALVQPALLCGYRLEDESLADEMLGAIEGERGALPLLAFAAARLWEHRDRETGLLTREAYERIGGVSGALAQHAEATLDRIGTGRHAMVREIFRNLVTAQGTRAVAERGELLSVFDDREIAAAVLQDLVTARLLTSFELPESREGAVAQHRVEIVHESLLTSWPRLVRWQTQDADSAQLRDQVRQAAQLWKERHESDDLLWTGTAYREFALWRERYPGGLTATEEAFAQAMSARADRQRRRRRIALTAAFTALVAVVLVIGWYARGERLARLNAEASRLVTLGRAELEEEPSVALAYSIASLEASDTPSNRFFALETLSREPAARILPLPPPFQITTMAFSPDGTKLVVGGTGGVQVLSRDGDPPVILEDTWTGTTRFPIFAPDGDRVVFLAGEDPATLRIWSLAKGKEIRTFRVDPPTYPVATPDRLILLTPRKTPSGGWEIQVRAWGYAAADPTLISRWDVTGVSTFWYWYVNPLGQWLAFTKDNEIYVCSIDHLATENGRLVGGHSRKLTNASWDPTGTRLASVDDSSEIRIWSIDGDPDAPLRVIRAASPVSDICFSPDGTMLAALCGSEARAHLWDLEGPIDAGPRVFRHQGNRWASKVTFDPTGQLLLVSYHDEIAIWPATRPNPYILKGFVISFASDSRSALGVSPTWRHLRQWSLHGEPVRDLWMGREIGKGPEINALDIDAQTQLAVLGSDEGISLVSLADGKEQVISRGDVNAITVALSPDGRRIAGTCLREGGRYELRIWEAGSDTFRVLESREANLGYEMRFSEDGSLFSSDSQGSIKRWNLEDGSFAEVGNGSLPTVYGLAVSRDGRYVLANFTWDGHPTPTTKSELKLFDLRDRTSQLITTHGDNLMSIALNPAGTLLVTEDYEGVIRVGPANRQEPHMLLGSPKGLWLSISPDGQWIACAGRDSTTSLWRMPEGQSIHTLPHEQFLDHLRAQTNHRVVPDPASRTGYRVEKVPVPGWGTIPSGSRP